jgi:hypothetical protein
MREGRGEGRWGKINFSHLPKVLLVSIFSFWAIFGKGHSIGIMCVNFPKRKQSLISFKKIINKKYNHLKGLRKKKD